ncbi:MAG: hypothetical protein Kow0047_20140 [Anaerolineae bacterium]
MGPLHMLPYAGITQFRFKGSMAGHTSVEAILSAGSPPQLPHPYAIVTRV